MSLFTKPEYKYREMPFTLIDDDDVLIEIEAYSEINGEMLYFLASYELSTSDENDYKELKDLLRNSENKTVLVELKYKKGILKSFCIQLDSLVKAYNDERFNQLGLLAWNIDDISCKDDM